MLNMFLRSWSGVVVCVLAFAGVVRGGGGPENVLVVVNGQSWSSLSIANEYVSLRGIPPGNVVVLQDLGVKDTEKIDVLRERILLPVLRHLEKAGLAAQIDYVVYSSDFPYLIDFSGDLGKHPLPKNVGKAGSLTGLTYLYQPVLTKRPGYTALNSNWYALQPFRPDLDPPWMGSDRELYGKVQQFFAEKHQRRAGDKEWTEEDRAWEKAEWEKSVATLRDLLSRQPHSLDVRYNLACGLAVLGQPDEAMRELTATIDGGWCDWAVAIAASTGWLAHTDFAKDDDFASLRERADFKELVRRAAEHEIRMPPARAFDASTGWTSDGARCAPYRGARYLLSTMLGYTNGRGNSYDEVVSYLRRARLAEDALQDGAVYLMRNKDIRSKTREWALPGVVRRLRADGRQVVIQEGAIPQGRPDVAGLSTGISNFDWAKSGSLIRPGAICEHLTSYGGVLSEGRKQTPLTALLAAGAAGASGTVVEPFAIQGKFPNAFIQAYYAEGCSLAEAFYQSVTGPYQLLIVGDPLCQPYAKRPVVQVEGLAENEAVKGSVNVKFSVDGEGPAAILCRLYLDGRQFAVAPPQGDVALPTDKLADGYHELGVVAVAADPVQAQGRRVVPFMVTNHHEPGDLLVLQRKECAYGEQIEAKADIPGATRVEVFASGHRLGSIDSGKGTVRLDTKMLGLGPVAIRYGVQFEDGSKYSGTPQTVTVLPPPALSLGPEDIPAKQEDGIQLRVKLADKTEDCTVAALSGDWLEKNGVAEGVVFASRGYFSVAQEGVHQFQLRGNLADSCRLLVDGEVQSVPPGDGWRCLPLFLGKGAHRFTLSGLGVNQPQLDVRFGGPGCRTVGGKRFRRGVRE